MLNKEKLVLILVNVIISIIFMGLPNRSEAVEVIYFGASLIIEDSATSINDIRKSIGYEIGESTIYIEGIPNEEIGIKDYQFDLKLVARIAEINGDKVPERILGVDITNLVNGTSTTADYNLDKTPVSVKNGDVVKYTFRVYNEGDIDGYVSEITEDISNGLEFLWSEKTDSELDLDTTLSEVEREAIKYNQAIWDIKSINKDTSKIELISTDYLAKGKGAEITTNDANLIKAFNSSSEYGNVISAKDLDYKEVSVYLKVTAENDTKTVIKNESAITYDTDSDGNSIDDRDSSTDIWVKYEDDEDYDSLIVQSFDLSLRKFITMVSGKEVITRIPQVKYDEEKNKITYEHDKDPVDVVMGDIVVYTLRIYNEGELDGYASKISDDIPDGLQYMPENELNKEYRWVMYDENGNITEDINNAVKVMTDYLSKEQGEVRMRKNSEIQENPTLLKASSKEKKSSNISLDYADVQIAFRVIEPSTSDGIIINYSQISDDTDENGDIVNDLDSTTDKWIEGEDDQDNEYINLNYFDLSLRECVTQTIIIENGKEIITQTEHTPDQEAKPVVNVELNKKNLDSTVVKFKYLIRVTNEADIAGYARKITDYIPEGFEFIAEDNLDWIDEGNNVISTRKLRNTLLQPGESADVEVILTWINSNDNIGVKVNVVEISEDYNDRHTDDIDSTIDNRVEGEDDMDNAQVILSVSTGRAKIFFLLGIVVLITVACGIVLINRFVI